MREERRKAKIAMQLAREENRKERLQAIKAREERKQQLKEAKRKDKEESTANRKFHPDNRKQHRENFLIVERNPKGQSQKMLNLNHNLSFLRLLLLIRNKKWWIKTIFVLRISKDAIIIKIIVVGILFHFKFV